MSPENVQEIIELLKQIVLKLGELSVPIYWVLYRQQLISGITTLVLDTLFGIGGYFASRKSLAWARTSKERYGWTEEGQAFTLGLFWFCIAVGVFILATCVQASIMRIINPNYYVIQSILEMVKPK